MSLGFIEAPSDGLYREMIQEHIQKGAVLPDNTVI